MYLDAGHVGLARPAGRARVGIDRAGAGGGVGVRTDLHDQAEQVGAPAPERGRRRVVVGSRIKYGRPTWTTQWVGSAFSQTVELPGHSARCRAGDSDECAAAGIVHEAHGDAVPALDQRNWQEYQPGVVERAPERPDVDDAVFVLSVDPEAGDGKGPRERRDG